MVKRIDISTQKYPDTYAIVDDEDYERVIGGPKWYCKWWGGATFYAARAVPCGRTQKSESMHRLIMKAEDNQIIDHINLNGLDNRKENLRITTNIKNLKRKPIQNNNKTGYKGVWRDSGGWRASITVERKTHHLGTFKKPEDAARAYDDAAIQHFGDLAVTNAMLVQEQPDLKRDTGLYAPAIRRDNTSGFLGVSFKKKTGKWQANINHNGKRHFLGYYDTPEAAADVYDRAAIKYHGEFARTNAMHRAEREKKKSA